MKSVYMNCPKCGKKIPTGILFLSHNAEHCHVPLIHNMFSPCPFCGSYCDLSGENECFDPKMAKGHAA